jgi:hypothetical protein
MMGGSDRPLPVLRVVFDDPHATWVHIDARTDAVLSRLDTGKRSSRGLLAMLHSWAGHHYSSADHSGKRCSSC